jgi:hypothetical protein
MSEIKKLQRNTEALAQCQPIYKIKEKEEPKVVANRLDLFKSNTSVRKPTANERTFDMFPNLIPMTTEIMLTSLEYATTLGAEMTGHSKISTATICFYQMFVLFGFFLVNDCYVRPSPSNAAKTWLQSSSRTRLLNFIKRLPVPSWMLPIFQQWAATCSNDNGNVFIVPSAASVSLETHYGKFFPSNFFTLLHDLSATLPGNSDPTVVFSKLFYTVLSTVHITGHTNVRKYAVCAVDLLGFTSDAVRNEHQYINSRLYQAFDSVFNPVLFRDQQRRKTFAKVSIMPTEFDSPTDFNIYDFLLCFNEQNDSELYVILETVATALDSPANFTKTLGQSIASRSGIYIFDHAYTDFLLPTWTTTTSNYADKIKGPSDLKKFQLTLVSNKARSQTLTFLSGTPPTSTSKTQMQLFSNIAAHTANTPPTADEFKYLDDAKVKTMKLISGSPEPPVYFGPTTSSSSISTELPDYISFDDRQHVQPEYQILDISGDAEETAWLIGLSGKIIESFELDGSTVAHPDPRNNTAEQNHQQGESLIPVKYTMSAFRFHPRDPATALLAPRARADNVSNDRVIASTHLIDRTTIFLPVSTLTIRDAAPPTGFPGISHFFNVNVISRFQYFLGFKADDRLNHADSDDEIPHMPTKRLYVFSPYMYTGYEDHRSNQFDPTKIRTYWVTNLRTHFGSDKPLIDATHPYKAHPLV